MRAVEVTDLSVRHEEAVEGEAIWLDPLSLELRDDTNCFAGLEAIVRYNTWRSVKYLLLACVHIHNCIECEAIRGETCSLRT